MNIAIIGLGYVGLTAAACLAKEGHRIIGVDVSEAKVRQIMAGKSPIFEPGLEELVKEALQAGRLSCYTEIGDHLAECDMAIVCVGTPSSADGSHNMTFIAESTRQIAASVARDRRTPLTVVYRSTIRPGTTEDLILPIFNGILGEDSGSIEVVYNPEFLRESVSISDFFSPPKIVIGTLDGLPNPRIDEMNKNINSKTFYTRYREAEITKFVDNSFHALKVAFANELGRICVSMGVGVEKVHEIFISDTKLNISPYYFRPGGAFGGSCLPKDVRALQHMSGLAGTNTPVIESLIRSNEAHKRFLFDMCTKGLPSGASVLMVGLAFKQDSDDLRESPNVDLARFLLQAGYQVSIYDPGLEPAKLLGQNLGYAYSKLPTLGQLLKPREFVEQQSFDLVIDTNGRSASLELKAEKVVDIYTLR